MATSNNAFWGKTAAKVKKLVEDKSKGFRPISSRPGSSRSTASAVTTWPTAGSDVPPVPSLPDATVAVEVKPEPESSDLDSSEDEDDDKYQKSAIRALDDAERKKSGQDAGPSKKEDDSEKEERKAAELLVEEQEERVKEVIENCDKYEKKLVRGIMMPKKMKTTFEHVRLPFATIEALRLLTSLALLRPDAFRYGVLKDNKILGVMLYGPPGTGKTHLAKAVAKESGATMLEISGADVLARYVGEGEKTVRAVFTLARKLDPCIIFFDEADAVFRGRSDDENGYHRELLNQFLHEWDGIANGKENSAFMMVATNRPYDLDEAVLRRLPRRILVDIPTYEDREAILKIYLADEKLGDDVDLKKLATSTPNYTGSDLKNLCVAAAFQSVYEETNAAGDGILSNFATKGRIATALAKKKGRIATALAKKKWPERRVLYGRHFDKARDEISSTIDTGSIDKIREFHRSRRVFQPERRVELPPPNRSRQQIKPKPAAAPA